MSNIVPLTAFKNNLAALKERNDTIMALLAQQQEQIQQFETQIQDCLDAQYAHFLESEEEHEQTEEGDEQTDEDEDEEEDEHTDEAEEGDEQTDEDGEEDQNTDEAEEEHEQTEEAQQNDPPQEHHENHPPEEEENNHQPEEQQNHHQVEEEENHPPQQLNPAPEPPCSSTLIRECEQEIDNIQQRIRRLYEEIDQQREQWTQRAENINDELEEEEDEEMEEDENDGLNNLGDHAVDVLFQPHLPIYDSDDEEQDPDYNMTDDEQALRLLGNDGDEEMKDLDDDLKDVECMLVFPASPNNTSSPHV